MQSTHPGRNLAKLAGLASTGLAFLSLDLLFLGVLARQFYQDALGSLMRPQPLAGPAATFYLLYILAVWNVAVRPSLGFARAFARGALIGAVAYGTYELTNWSLINGWPPRLVPVDCAWGTLLTGVSAALGASVQQKFGQ
ncbi:DUF2177 family protein [bacterium]|nr:DUF2177 family protein [bacterium]